MASFDTRTSRDGSKKYRVRVCKHGQTRTATFTRKTDAKEWASSTEADLCRGYYVPHQKDLKRTLGEAIDRYLTDVLPVKRRNRDQTSPKRHLNWWKDRIGHVPIVAIDDSLITKHLNELLNGKTHYDKPRSPSTCNRYLVSLSLLFNTAIKRWRWLQINPVRYIEKFEEPKGRDRILSDDERERLLVACKRSVSKDLYTIAVLALSTGMRRGEILSLTWKDIDLKHQRIVIPITKNGESRVVPLIGYALKLMKEHAKVRRLDTTLVFVGLKPDKPIDFRQAWKTALSIALIDDFRFHDLRHCCASYLAMNGASQAELSEILGHKTLAMTKRYTHFMELHTSKVVESMNAKMFK